MKRKNENVPCRKLTRKPLLKHYMYNDKTFTHKVLCVKRVSDYQATSSSTFRQEGGAQFQNWKYIILKLRVGKSDMMAATC